jgi:hypothetical protein
MTPTPRTDAAIAASDGQWNFVLRDLAQELERELAESAESLAFQTQLNREVIELEKKTFAELAAEREQITILRSDEKRLVGFTKTYRLRSDDAEAKLEQERQDRKQADLDTIRALGERNDARAELSAERALADRLASVLRTYNYDLLAGEMIQFVPEHDIALAAWKEARNDA